MKTSMKETKKMVALDFDGNEKMLNCVTPDGIVARVDIAKITMDQAFELFGMKDAIEFTKIAEGGKTL